MTLPEYNNEHRDYEFPYGPINEKALSELTFVVVTRGRPNNQLTLKSLPKRLLKQTIVVCSADTDDSSQIQSDFPDACVINAPLEVNSLAKKRQWTMEHLNSRGLVKILMFDDDLHFSTRSDFGTGVIVDGRLKDNEAWDKFRRNHRATYGKPQYNLAREEIHGIPEFRLLNGFAAVSVLLDTYAHGSIAPQRGNDVAAKTIGTINGVEFGTIARGTYAHAFRTDIFAKENIDYRDMPIREDFYATMQLLRKGYMNFQVTGMIIVPTATMTKGGLEAERDTAFSDKCAEDLATMFNKNGEKYVAVVQKDFNHAPRKEVSIQWKKLYTKGVEEFGLRGKSQFPKTAEACENIDLTVKEPKLSKQDKAVCSTKGTITRYRIEDFKGGWFVGDFEPTLHAKPVGEVGIKTHPKGEVWPKHYHKKSDEINYVVSGKVRISGETYGPGDIFVISKLFVCDPEFLEDCTIVCVKTKSVKGDKYEVSR